MRLKVTKKLKENIKNYIVKHYGARLRKCYKLENEKMYNSEMTELTNDIFQSAEYGSYATTANGAERFKQTLIEMCESTIDALSRNFLGELQ